MENKLFDELTVKELEDIMFAAYSINSMLQKHFTVDVIMSDKHMSNIFAQGIATSNLCFAQLKKIFKNDPDSIYSKL
jgi:hypothetical protein